MNRAIQHTSKYRTRYGPLLVLCLGAFPVGPASYAAEALDIEALGQRAAQVLEEAPEREIDPVVDSFLRPVPEATISSEDMSQALRDGRDRLSGVMLRASPLSGDRRNSHYFEGTWQSVHHKYVGRDVFAYEKGVYAIPGKAAYIGTFTYFPRQPTVWYKDLDGTYVIVGKRVKPGGEVETGIFAADASHFEVGLLVFKATPAYVNDLDRRYAEEAAAYRRKLAAEKRASESSIGFGQLLSLGLGATVIGASDLAPDEMLQLGTQYVGDVMDGGEGEAILGLYEKAIGSVVQSRGSDGIFEGGMSFSTPALEDVLKETVMGSGGAPSLDGLEQAMMAESGHTPAPPPSTGARSPNSSQSVPSPSESTATGGGSRCGDPDLVGTWERTTGTLVTERIEINGDCTGSFRQWSYADPASVDGQFQKFKWTADASASQWSLDYTSGVACDFSVGVWKTSSGTDSSQGYTLRSSRLILGGVVYKRSRTGSNGNPRAGGRCTQL